MLEFRPVAIGDKKIFDRSSFKMGEGSCDFAFANIFCWACKYSTEIAEQDGFIFVRFRGNDSTDYIYIEPIGEGDNLSAFNKIVEYTNSNAQPLKMAGLSSNFTEKIRASHSFCNYYLYPCREQFDYIYNASQLQTLSGKKLQPKRNHINTFKKLYNFSFEPLSSRHKTEVMNLLEEWYVGKENANIREYINERDAIERGMDNFEELDLRGVALYVEEELVAFSYGSAINEHTFCVHVEKGSAKYEGSFAMVNNLLANSLPSNFCYINREEDLGIQGLRTAKLSYQPIMLYPKFSLIELVGNEEKIEEIKLNIEAEEVAMLWREAFGDDEEFIERYIREIRPFGKSYLLHDRDMIVSSADLFLFKDNISLCPYIYGLTTRGDYRNKGYARSLMIDIFECINRNGGNRCMLIPGDKGLVQWYEGMGFSKQESSPVQLLNDIDFDFGTGDDELNLPQYRVINVERYLSTYASLYPNDSFEVAVSDDILSFNNGLFRVGEGRVEKVAKNISDNLISIAELFSLYPLKSSEYKFKRFKY